MEYIGKTIRGKNLVNFLFNWANNSKRKTMKGRVCKVLARGKMNSILIEFCDNKQKEIVSRNSLVYCKK